MPTSNPADTHFGDVREMISAQRINERIAELGRKITEDYDGKPMVLLAVLKGSFIFLADLCRAIKLPLSVEFLGVASYGDETKSSGVVQITIDLTRPIEGKHVLVVEDIVDTGLTMEYLLENLRTRKPASIKVCSLLDKPDRRIKAVQIDYLGFSIPDAFVVGYGLDFGQKFRNLPYIGLIE
jgi:hypoxanthine phosphoribosyltransferase